MSLEIMGASMAGMSRFFIFFVLLFQLFSVPALGSENAKVLHATLSNGLRVVIVQNTLAPVVATQVNYLVGSNEAPEGFPGMAHAQEHMMFRGSPGLSAAQLAHIMALMGGNFNAVTQQTITQYLFTVPKDNLDVALTVEAVRMRDVLNTQELWEEERGALEQEVAQDISNPEYVFYTRLLSSMFAGTSYEHDALGTRPSFQKTTSSMLKTFYNQWYGPNNAILVVAGDVDPNETLTKIRNLFGSIPSRPVPPRPDIRLHPLKPAAIALETDLPYGLAIVAYRLPGFDSPDFAAGQILADALDNRRSNLSALVPTGKALFTEFNGESFPQASYGYATVAFPYDGDGATLVSAIKNIVAEYSKHGVPLDLVESSKRHEIAEAEFLQNSIEGLASAWSQAIAAEGRSSPEDDIIAIKKVTVDDVNRVLKEYLVNDTAVTAVLTPRPSGRPITVKKFGDKESFAPKETTPVELPSWAKKSAKTPPIPTSRINPEVFTLPNGLRLIVQPENISATVSVFGQIRNHADLEEPEGKEGVSEVLESLFSYGTMSFDRIAFLKAQDDIGADIAAGTHFSLKVLSDNFERGMKLLADNLLHPALPAGFFPIVQSEILNKVQGQLQSPAYLSQRALQEALYPQGDPVLRKASPETVRALSLRDIVSFYAKAFRPDMTTIVVVGRVKPEEAKTVVERYFGSWKTHGPKPETELPRVPLNKPSAVVVQDASRVQDQVTLAEIIGISRAHPDYYKLQLGNHVLSGAFYATRLYRDLREKTGLVYTVESFLEAKQSRALFGVFFACDPQNISRARILVDHNLKALQTTTVTPEELERAKTLLIHRIPLSESSVDAIGEGLLSRSLEDLPLDEPVRSAEQYVKITAEQIRDAFAKWIRIDDFAQVVVGPNP